jgi:hypothetical protein
VAGRYKLTLFTIDGEFLSAHEFDVGASFKYEGTHLEPMIVESFSIDYLEPEDDGQPD